VALADFAIVQKKQQHFVVKLKQGLVNQALYMLQPCTPLITCYFCVTGPFLSSACHGELAIGQQQYLTVVKANVWGRHKGQHAG